MVVLGLACGLCAPVLAAPGPDCSRPLSLALHEHGLLYSADTATGIDKDVADELARRSGCRLLLSLMPRARIWQLIETGALDFSLSGISNPARERFAAFAWYFSNKYYLLARRDAQVDQLADFERNEGLQLGVIRSFRYGDGANRFVDALAERQRLTQSSGLSALFAALQAGQIQAMIVEPFDFPTLDAARIREQTRIIEFGDPAVPHGLIMSRASLSESERAKWRALIDGMRGDGTMQRIFEKYFKPDLARAMVGQP
ncbi:MAG: transporter substrate-binding domain-containing protein [Burkholderiaceae bacterium]